VGWLMGFIFSFKRKPISDSITFDPSCEDAVIRSSICTGEKVAGFKNRNDGHFTEVMIIRSLEDEEFFKEKYGIDEVRVEY